MSKGCIIYCIEKGILEKYTILSILSVKRFGGFLAQYDIFCFQPRKEFPVSEKTKRKLRELNVLFIDQPLNTRHRYYSFANKSVVCDYMAREYKYENYVFLDSDSLVLAEPVGYQNSDSDIALCPVYTRGLGITESDDENKKYWKKLFKISGIEYENLPKVKTVFGEEEIVAFWNAGIIFVKGRNDIFKRWNELLVQLLEQKIFPSSGIFFVEQISLAITLLSGGYKVEALPIAYNFPLDERMLEKKAKPALDEIVIMHHLSNLDLLFEGDQRMDGNEKYEWIKEKVIELKIFPRSGIGRIMDKSEHLVRLIKERLYYFIYTFTSRYHE